MSSPSSQLMPSVYQLSILAVRIMAGLLMGRGDVLPDEMRRLRGIAYEAIERDDDAA